NNFNIKLTEEAINLLKNDKNYNTILAWFFNEAPTSKISEQVVNDIISKYSIIIEGHNTTLDNILKNIHELSFQLELISREELEKDLAATTEQLDQIEREIKKYEIFLNLNLGISNIPTIKQDLLAILETRLTAFQDEIRRRGRVWEQYEKLEAYTENLIPFLRIAKFQEENETDEKEINFLEIKVRIELEEEIKNIKDQLEKKVEQFFYIDLINSIYNKIDPHPIFKNVDFKVNLDEDDPSLDIFVVDENPNKRLVPNLYFSTAQINILSLSIFLASALNSNTYNCIFIDDPIQSLDSINILSTIDLLRSIVVNYGRQIVLSTHDENFHKLLARKIPSEFFKSKFIELETFGKVKKDN
ncbi:hypothetical protein, partial [[Flexibacter] sp. ATCC 35208]|uniref:hypothetical protein n=1 Tax=[Flexibacter] sp. ATCC 35208 TaxID=1936242 RepID=UPI0009C768DC